MQPERQEPEEELEESIEESIEEETGPNEETLALAKSMGWVEEDSFRGDKSNWVGADKFVDKGMNDLPILRERVRAQSRKMNEMESDIKDFKVHHEDTLSREYQRAMRDLEEKQLATVEEGDKDEYQRLQDKKQELANNRSQTTRPAKAPDNPLYSAWKDKNAEWFDKDPEMTDYANTISDFVASRHPELIGTQGFLDEVDKRIRKEYSNKFENPNRNEPTAVETGGRAPRQRSGGKSYSDLPQDAKAACDKFVRRGLVTREQYLKEYEWE